LRHRRRNSIIFDNRRGGALWASYATPADAVRKFVVKAPLSTFSILSENSRIPSAEDCLRKIRCGLVECSDDNVFVLQRLGLAFG